MARDLAFGESCSVDVRFEALQDRAKGFIFSTDSPLFSAEVMGDFDIIRFFNIRKQDFTYIPCSDQDELEA